MMYLGFTSPQAAWMAALLVVWAALLFGGFVFGKPNADGTRRMPRGMRIGSSVALAVAGWSWVAVAGGQLGSLPWLIAAGMTCGLIGDLFLAGLLPGRHGFLSGIAAFALGHVAYIAGLWTFGSRYGLAAPGPRWGALAAWLLLGVAGWYVVIWRGHHHTLLHRIALPYALLLAGTAGVATGLALQAAVFWPLALGATLFLFSDLLIAARRFNGVSFRLVDDVVWLTYGPGQMFIVYAVAAALAAAFAAP